MEYLSISNPLLPSALVAFALIITLFFIFKKRSFHHAKTRDCPHCKSVIESNQAECENCHRKVIFG